MKKQEVIQETVKNVFKSYFNIIDKILTQVSNVDQTEYLREFFLINNLIEQLRELEHNGSTEKKEEAEKIINKLDKLGADKKELEKLKEKYINSNLDVPIEMLKTNLDILDKHAETILRVLNEAKVVKRNFDKPMMTPKAILITIKWVLSESHLTTRGIHQQEVSDAAAEIAKALGLNVELARIGGKHHDDGHSFSGHLGERIANKIGKIHNCMYIVHNALGVNVLKSEDIIQKIKSEIIRIENLEESDLTEKEKDNFLNKLEEQLWYVFDIMVSHNGEGTNKTITPNQKKTIQNIKDDINLCYTTRGAEKSIVPGTLEGALVAMVDRICYVRTDLIDGSSLGILKKLDDDYLRYIGILAAQEEGNLDLINMGNLLLNQKIKFEELIKKKSTTKEGREQLKGKYGIFEEVYNKYLEATLNYGKMYVNNIPIETRTEQVANMIKNVCIQDVKEYSKGKTYIAMSPIIGEAFNMIKLANLEQIVKDTRRKFEMEKLPKVVYKIHMDLSNALIETGAIGNYLATKKKRDSEMYLSDDERKARKKHGIEIPIRNTQPDDKGKEIISTKLKNTDEKENKFKKIYIKLKRKDTFERKVCHNFLRVAKRNPEIIEEYEKMIPIAVENITRREVMQAIGKENIEEEDLLQKEYIKKIADIMSDINKKYPNGIKDEDIEFYIKDLTEYRKKNKEQLLADAYALSYVAGMSDITLIVAAKVKGYLNSWGIRRGYNRGAPPDKGLNNLGNAWKNQDRDI